MKFGSDKSHVRRLTKAESTEMGIPASRESYVVKKTYHDPFENKVHHAGEILSNRQGRNVQAQESGRYKSYSQYTRIWKSTARATDKDVKARNAWIRKTSKKTGKTPDKIRADPEFRKRFTDFYFVTDQDRKNKKPSGPLAKLLVAAGLRDEDDTHDVGDTPKQESKK